MKITIEQLSKLLTERLNRPVVITAIEPLASGYHSDGYKVADSDGRFYFLKKVKSFDMGFEHPARHVNSLLTSDAMGKRAEALSAAAGVILLNDEAVHHLPDLDEQTEIYHLQDFYPSAESYWDKLQRKKMKTVIDTDDQREIEQVVVAIAMVHAKKFDSADEKRLKNLYNDGLRSLITNPELTLILLQRFPDDHFVLPRAKHAEHLGLMMEQVYHWEKRFDRLRALHGDFWGTNVLMSEDHAQLVDFSRIPWGDPGIDVGWWVGQYLWFYFETGNSYFKKLVEYFFEKYINATGDTEIRQACVIPFGFSAMVYIHPVFYPDINRELATRFFLHLQRLMRVKNFAWD